MSADGSVTLEWADGEHKFRLAIGQLRELQERINAPRIAMGATPIGPAQLADALRSGAWLVDDVRETLRLGLIGAGMKPPRALALVQRYVDQMPVITSVGVAQVVILSALVGVPEDQPGKQAEGEGEEDPQTVPSSSPSSTETGPRLVSHLDR